MSDRDARPGVGDRAPDFTLPGADGKPVRLADLLAQGTLVLYFYPKDETTGCTVEACAFRDSYQDFTDAGAQVVGVSRDDALSHARFAAHHRLPFLLLSDPSGEVHARYGVRSLMGGLVKDRLTFVIDRAGVIRDVFSARLRFAAHARGALELVRTLAGAAPGSASASSTPPPHLL
jgi:thioredoxin-dependent peroxiredoxin